MTNNTLEINQFYGTEKYHKISDIFKSVVTDGVFYVYNGNKIKNPGDYNGDYSWFITDSLAVIEHHKSCVDQPFLHITLDATDKDNIQMIIDDGNENVLYTQNYDSIIVDYALPNNKLELYWVQGNDLGSPDVLELTGEY